MRIKTIQTAESPGATDAPVKNEAAGLFKFAAKPAATSDAAVVPSPASKKSWFSRRVKAPKTAEVPPSAGLFVPVDQVEAVASTDSVGAPAAAAKESANSGASLLARFAFSRRSKAPAAPKAPSMDAPKGDKPPRTKMKLAPKKRPVAKGSGAASILVELEDGTALSWMLHPNKLEPIQREDLAGRVASFTSKDFRFASDLPLTASGAQNFAVAELAEDARVINTSKTARSIYATTTTRVNEFAPVQLGPGLLLLEGIVPFADNHGQERVVGVQLQDESGSLALVVLYHVTPRGEVGQPQVAVNPGELQFVLQQFLAARRLDPDATPLTLLGNDDLLRAFDEFQSYPAESTFLGLPLSVATRGVAAIAVAAALAAAGYAGYGYHLDTTAKAALSRANAEKASALQQAEALLVSSLASFSQTQALDLKAVAGIAQQVWVPGAKVSMEATLATAVYKVDMPLTNLASGGTSVLSQVQPDRLQALLEAPAPEGCTKSIMNLSGGLNAAQTIVECQNTVGSLRSYRLD